MDIGVRLLEKVPSIFTIPTSQVYTFQPRKQQTTLKLSSEVQTEEQAGIWSQSKVLRNGTVDFSSSSSYLGSLNGMDWLVPERDGSSKP